MDLFNIISTPSDGGIATDKMDYNGPVALNLTADGSGHSESMNHPKVWGHIEKLLNGDWESILMMRLLRFWSNLIF